MPYGVNVITGLRNARLIFYQESILVPCKITIRILLTYHIPCKHSHTHARTVK